MTTANMWSPGLAIGKYEVKAEAPGFKAQATQGVTLNVNDRIRVDFQMTVGAAAETISVEANALAVQTDSSEQSSVITGTQITELATNGRTIYSYAALTPGASNLNPDSQLPVPTGGASSNISFNGNRNGHNLYLLDGGENADRGGAGSSSVLPSIDAISETQILTSNYSAEYGLSSGGTISSAIKSGSSSLHASAWEFFRNDALDARNFFNPAPQPVGELRYNIFGFNVGGPVTFGKLYNQNRKRTFFFYNMEWRKFVFGGSPLSQQVPPTSEYDRGFRSDRDKCSQHKLGHSRNSSQELPGRCSSRRYRAGAAVPRQCHSLLYVGSQFTATTDRRRQIRRYFPGPDDNKGRGTHFPTASFGAHECEGRNRAHRS